MDINMPVIDGVEATLRISQLIQSGRILPVPVVALTAAAWKQEEEDHYFHDIGFNAFLPKPITRAGYNEVLARYGIIAHN